MSVLMIGCIMKTKPPSGDPTSGTEDMNAPDSGVVFRWVDGCANPEIWIDGKPMHGRRSEV